MAYGIEDKVRKPLYEGVQLTQIINNSGDVRGLFVAKGGVSESQFDEASDSFAVKALVAAQVKAAGDFNLTQLPATYIAAKNMINVSGLDGETTTGFVKMYVDVMNFLLGLGSSSTSALTNWGTWFGQGLFMPWKLYLGARKGQIRLGEKA